MGQCVCSCVQSENVSILRTEGEMEVTYNGVTKKFTNALSANVVNNRIFVDGVDMTSQFSPNRSMRNNMIVMINIKGNTGDVKTISGDVNVVGNTTANITTVSGDVVISGNVNGSITTVSGDVKANNILGSCRTTSGDISR
jgi:hypothetical protein